MRASAPRRPISTTLVLGALWFLFYASFTLFRPALLDDADSVHAEVAREMLLRHDYVTLYANGIRYLEKAPLMYWAMAACMRVSQLLKHGGPSALAVAARVPLAIAVLALVFVVEAFARRAFRSAYAGLYAALITMLCPGLFLFTRITLPDAMLCLWLSLAILCFWIFEANATLRHPRIAAEDDDWHYEWDEQAPRWLCYGFASACALGVLTKGIIGALFPVAIVGIYLLATRGPRGAFARLGRLHPISSALVFLALAVPWHLSAAYENPDRGIPGEITFTGLHFQVAAPTPGNVHGWAWFYFVNEQLLRYLNARLPRDYDTVPLWLFWGLCLVWLLPWSAFLFKAIGPVGIFVRSAINAFMTRNASTLQKQWAYVRWHPVSRVFLLLTLWALVPLLFFSFSTRQEYYVLPALPAAALLIAGWLAIDARVAWQPLTQAARSIRRANLRCTLALVVLGTLFACASAGILLYTRRIDANVDPSVLLQRNHGDYALSMGHFLDLNLRALALFRVPLGLASASLLFGSLFSYLLRRSARPQASTISLAACSAGFLLAVHLALQTFAPVISSAKLAEAIGPQIAPDDLIVIHQEFEYGSTLAFYLQRPNYFHVANVNIALNPIHILTEPEHDGTPDYGRSANLWYGSFFPDAPEIFETAQSLGSRWHGPQRIFLWQDQTNEPAPLPAAFSPAYIITSNGGKEIVSNRPISQPGQSAPPPAPHAQEQPNPEPEAGPAASSSAPPKSSGRHSRRISRRHRARASLGAT